MKNIIIDSSVFISALIEEETHHQVSLRYLESLLSSSQKVQVIIPRLVLIEISNVLFRLYKDSKKAKKLIVMIKNTDNYHIVDIDEEVEASTTKCLTKMSLKTSDLIICSIAHVAQGTLVSWDKKMMKEFNKVGQTQTPA